MVLCQPFGYLSDGRRVMMYTIASSSGQYVELLDYGASVHRIVVPDREGQLGDVILGAPDAERLLSSTYVGGTIGRAANRIAYGRYEINGTAFQLEQNMSHHFLHGASGNYAKKIFELEPVQEEDTVAFRLHDDGDGGFGCEADILIRYTFNGEGRLGITYEMTASGDTVFNPTNHMYFNLAGGGEIREHYLKLNARYRAGRDEEGIPDGGLIPVENTPADFTKRRCIRQALLEDKVGYFQKQPPGYDEYYQLDEKGYKLAAELDCPATGRWMLVYTDMPCIILFAGGGRAPEAGKDGQIYQGYCGVCLETEFMPNAVNCPQYDSPIFLKGQKLVSHTIYEFGWFNELAGEDEGGLEK